MWESINVHGLQAFVYFFFFCINEQILYTHAELLLINTHI